MARYSYLPKKWAKLKARILSRPVAITDEERRAVDSEVGALEDLLKRFRAAEGDI